MMHKTTTKTIKQKIPKNRKRKNNKNMEGMEKYPQKNPNPA